MVEQDLFGEVPAVMLKSTSRRRDAVPAGYGGIPGTGPEGETCGSCKHHVVKRMAKNYHKCFLAKAKWTGGSKSDIRVRMAACSRWEPTPPTPSGS